MYSSMFFFSGPEEVISAVGPLLLGSHVPHSANTAGPAANSKSEKSAAPLRIFISISLEVPTCVDVISRNFGRSQKAFARSTETLARDAGGKSTGLRLGLLRAALADVVRTVAQP